MNCVHRYLGLTAAQVETQLNKVVRVFKSAHATLPPNASDRALVEAAGQPMQQWWTKSALQHRVVRQLKNEGMWRAPALVEHNLLWKSRLQAIAILQYAGLWN
jgi:hypothetical protein